MLEACTICCLGLKMLTKLKRAKENFIGLSCQSIMNFEVI